MIYFVYHKSLTLTIQCIDSGIRQVSFKYGTKMSGVRKAKHLSKEQDKFS